MQRIFLTHILPEHHIARYGLSFAGCNFSRNLMSGGGFDKVYSILPLFTSGAIDEEAFNDTRFELEYCHFIRKNGNRLATIAVFVEQWRIFRKIPKDACVWTYNLNTLHAFLFILLKIFKPSVKVNVIVLDFTPVVKGFGLNKIYLKLINRAHGIICLSYNPLFTCKNKVVLPGVVPVGAGKEPLLEHPDNKYLLSGALNEVISQTSMVLKAFSELPKCELHITGTIDDDTMIKEYAQKYPNIIYHGKVSFEEYLYIMHSCTFQLSTRNPENPENQCNFPSKVIETLLHNRIVVSTIKYKQLDGIKYFKTTSEPEYFKQHIEAISSLSKASLMEYANQGKKVAEMFSTKVWNETMTKIENA